MLTEYLEMLHGSLAPPQGWDTNTVKWGENLRKENCKGLRWVKISEDRMPRFEGFEGFILGSKRRWVTPFHFFVLELIYTVTQLWFWTSIALFLCGPSSMNILESSRLCPAYTRHEPKKSCCVSAFKTASDCFFYPLARYKEFTKIIQQLYIWGNFSGEN